MEKSFRISSTAMAPGLQVDQCVRARIGHENVLRGAVVAFRNPRDEYLISRVIGMPGDRIAVSGGIPIIDGVIATRESLPPLRMPGGAANAGPECAEATCEIARFRETLPGGASYEVLDTAPGSISDERAELVVPEGHLFLMGDNRDSALDSRWDRELGGPGMVPMRAVFGALISPVELSAPAP